MSRRSRPFARAPGHLVIIGGGEDRTDGKPILARFVELSGGPGSRIAVITAASRHHAEMMAVYTRAFGDLGVSDLVPVRVDSRAEADDPRIGRLLEGAGGIFMTGGDQRRLVALVGGTALACAMHQAFEAGTCIGGTSAGASALSERMLAAAEPASAPDQAPPAMSAGLGFLRGAAVDEHFSERRRLGRLLCVVASNPDLLGMGIDEDTAVVVEPNAGVEVLGTGAVTLIDGREALRAAHGRGGPQLSSIRLHVLPSGFHCHVDAGDDPEPCSLAGIIRSITRVETGAGVAPPLA